MYVHSCAPCRIGIAGGGTDLPVWTRERTGRCLSLAINVYAHAVAITRPDRQVVASYRQRDNAACATEIANGLIRESALMHGWEEGFEVHTLSEVTSHGSGLGVSSAFAVALAATFARMTLLETGKTAEPKWMVGGEQMFKQGVATDAWTVEIDRLRRPIGRQDHMAAAHGSLRLYRFEKDTATIEAEFAHADALWLAQRLCLVQLPEGHDSRAILSGVKSTEALEHAYRLVDESVQAVRERNLSLLGSGLHCGHVAKRLIPGAVPAWLDEITDSIEDLCHGYKVAGAGGGGHLLVACEPESIDAIGEATRLPVHRVAPDFDGVRSEGWA